MTKSQGRSGCRLVVRSDQMDEEGWENLVNLVLLLEKWERELTLEQGKEIFRSENLRSECSQNSE